MCRPGDMRGSIHDRCLATVVRRRKAGCYVTRFEVWSCWQGSSCWPVIHRSSTCAAALFSLYLLRRVAAAQDLWGSSTFPISTSTILPLPLARCASNVLAHGLQNEHVTIAGHRWCMTRAAGCRDLAVCSSSSHEGEQSCCASQLIQHRQSTWKAAEVQFRSCLQDKSRSTVVGLSPGLEQNSNGFPGPKHSQPSAMHLDTAAAGDTWMSDGLSLAQVHLLTQ